MMADVWAVNNDAVTDYYTQPYGIYTDTDNLQNKVVSTTSGVTTATFTRALNTGDTRDEVVLCDATSLDLVWALGSSSTLNQNSGHAQSGNQANVELSSDVDTNPDPTPIVDTGGW